MIAFRVGHTFLSESLLMHNGVSPMGSISLLDAFFDPGMARSNPALIDEILIGQTNQAANISDSFIIDEVRSNLFGSPNSGEGRDLAALNIQRARDHGIPNYNDVRAGFGLPRMGSFSDLSSNADVVARLTEAYGEIDLCYAFICGNSEDSAEGGQLGETFSTIIADQFTRSMNGDAHFFIGDPDVRNQDLIDRTGISVDNVTLADVINANTIGGVGPDAMRI